MHTASLGMGLCPTLFLRMMKLEPEFWYTQPGQPSGWALPHILLLHVRLFYWTWQMIWHHLVHCCVQRYQNGEVAPGSEDRDQFLSALRSSIEIFVNRMRSNSQRGRSIANDSSVQTLFMTLTAMHPQLLQYIHQQEDQRGICPVYISCLSVCLSVRPFVRSDVIHDPDCHASTAVTIHPPTGRSARYSPRIYLLCSSVWVVFLDQQLIL